MFHLYIFNELTFLSVLLVFLIHNMNCFTLIAKMGNIPSCCIHRWKIANFSWFLPGGRLHWKEYIDSQPFKPENSELTFFIRLCPHGLARGYASFELVLESGRGENVNLKLTFDIEDRNGQKHFQQTLNHNFDENGQFRCYNFIKHAELEQDKEYLLPNDTLTICCVIRRVGDSKLDVSQMFTKTEPNAWTIKNITDYLNDGKLSWKRKLCSKSFSTSDGNLEFYLSLNPNGSEDDHKDHLLVYLHLRKESDVKFNYALSLVDANGTKRNIKIVTNHTFSKNGFGYPKFISHADLLNTQNIYLSQNKLTVRVDIEDVGNELIRGYVEPLPCNEIAILSHEWTIEKFTDYLNDDKLRWKNCLKSKEFPTGDDETKFYIALYLNGRTDELKEHISVFLINKKTFDAKFNITFSLIDANGSRRNIEALTNQTLLSQYDHDKYISHIDLFHPRNNYLSNKKLTIRVDVEEVDRQIIPDYSETRSTTKSNYHVHIWTIEKYQSLVKCLGWTWRGFTKKPEKMKYIESSQFSTPNGKTKFYLSLYPSTQTKDISLKLHLVSCDNPESEFTCTFSILGDGVRRETREHTQKLSIGDNRFCFLCSFNALNNSKNGFLPNDELTIYCGISDSNEELIRGYTETRSTTTAL